MMEELEDKIRQPTAYFISSHHIKAKLERSAVQHWESSPTFVLLQSPENITIRLSSSSVFQFTLDWLNELLCLS